MKNVELNLLLLGDLAFSNSCPLLSFSLLIIIFYTADFGLSWLQTGFKNKTKIEFDILTGARARRPRARARQPLNLKF